MEISSTKELDLFKYKSVIEFLNDFYRSKKKMDSQFSYELLAIELNFKSRSMMRMIFKGQIKITDTFIHRLSNYLKLNQKQKDYFILLSRHHNTNVQFLKTTYFNKINELSNFIEDEEEISDYDAFLSAVEIPTIHILLSYEDTQFTAEQIAHTTGYSMPAVENALNQLKKMGLAVSVTSQDSLPGYWKSTRKNVTLNNQQQKNVLDQFHQATLSEAQQKTALDSKERKFRSIHLTMDKENYDNFTQEIEDFIQRTKNKYISKNLDGKQLYKFNLQAYPLTQKL